MASLKLIYNVLLLSLIKKLLIGFIICTLALKKEEKKKKKKEKTRKKISSFECESFYRNLSLVTHLVSSNGVLWHACQQKARQRILVIHKHHIKIDKYVVAGYSFFFLFSCFISLFAFPSTLFLLLL